MGLFNKKELARIAELERENAILKSTLDKTQGLSIAQEEKYLQKLKEQNQKERSQIRAFQKDVEALVAQKQALEQSLADLNLEVDFAEVGLYKPPYSALSSDQYKEKLENNRAQQKTMVKNGTAVTGNMSWTVNGDAKAGKKMVKDDIKMVLRAFNNECTVIVGKVRFGNLEKAHKQVVKLVERIEKLNTTHDIKISKKYIQLKLEELELQYNYLQEKQREKEILREQRAEEREKAKLQKEIEAKKKSLQKEQSHYLQAKEKFEARLATAEGADAEELEKEIQKINDILSDVETNLKAVDYREANKRAGCG